MGPGNSQNYKILTQKQSPVGLGGHELPEVEGLDDLDQPVIYQVSPKGES